MTTQITPDYWRQLGIVTPDELSWYPVTLIGVGGIGSITAQVLTKMGVTKLTVFDDDKVELHNLPNQIYGTSHLGLHKVEALKVLCQEFAGVEITAIPSRYKDENLNGIVISAVDSMKSRIDIWKHVRYNPHIRLYIEARMGAQIAVIYVVQPCNETDIANYEETLYSDEDALEEPCTERAIIYNVYLMAALIANIVKRVAKSEPIGFNHYFDFVNLLFSHGPLTKER